jgi:hypothetical protein
MGTCISSVPTAGPVAAGRNRPHGYLHLVSARHRPASGALATTDSAAVIAGTIGGVAASLNVNIWATDASASTPRA